MPVAGISRIFITIVSALLSGPDSFIAAQILSQLAALPEVTPYGKALLHLGALQRISAPRDCPLRTPSPSNGPAHAGILSA
jgi:hypothetical protein